MSGWRQGMGVALLLASVAQAAPLPTVQLCLGNDADQRPPWTAELAASPAERAQGFRHRPAPDDHTLIYFLYAEDQDRTGFWMHEVEAALDIAFIAADGRVLAIRTMPPCAGPAARCPVYDAPAPFRAALEGAAGVMARRGLQVGDHLRRCDG